MTCGYRDGWGRRCTQLVAIDALMLSRQSNQFEASKVSRELNKVISQATLLALDIHTVYLAFCHVYYEYVLIFVYYVYIFLWCVIFIYV